MLPGIGFAHPRARNRGVGQVGVDDCHLAASREVAADSRGDMAASVEWGGARSGSGPRVLFQGPASLSWRPDDDTASVRRLMAALQRCGPRTGVADALDRLAELEVHLRDHLRRVGDDPDVRRGIVRSVLREAPADRLAQTAMDALDGGGAVA